MTKLFLFILLSLFLFNSCVEEKSKEGDKSVIKKESVSLEKENKVTSEVSVDLEKTEITDWSNLIYFHTDKDISSKAKIEISFIRNFEDGVKLDDVLTFTPEIKGKIELESNYKIVFTPNSPLKQGQVYEASLDTSKLIKALPKGYENFKFKFNIVKQKAILKVSGFENNTKKNNHTIRGSINFTDTINEDIVKKSLTAVQSEKKINIKLIKNTDKSFGITISGVKKLEKESEVLIKFDGKELSLDTQEEKIRIPALARFEILKISAINGASRYINITFSDSLDAKQNLKGLITVKKYRRNKRIKLEVNNNNIKVYFNKEITGKVEVRVKSGIKSSNKKKLKKSFKETVTFENLKPSVKFVGKGVILPDGKKLIVPFEAVNLKSVKVRALRVYP